MLRDGHARLSSPSSPTVPLLKAFQFPCAAEQSSMNRWYFATGTSSMCIFELYFPMISFAFPKPCFKFTARSAFSASSFVGHLISDGVLDSSNARDTSSNVLDTSAGRSVKSAVFVPPFFTSPFFEPAGRPRFFGTSDLYNSFLAAETSISWTLSSASESSASFSAADFAIIFAADCPTPAAASIMFFFKSEKSLPVMMSFNIFLSLNVVWFIYFEQLRQFPCFLCHDFRHPEIH